MSLFDVDMFTAPGATPRRPRKPTPPRPRPNTEPVIVNSTWRYAHPKTPGIVHAGTKKTKLGATVAYCGKLVAALSYMPGETVHGCSECITRGAPR